MVSAGQINLASTGYFSFLKCYCFRKGHIYTPTLDNKVKYTGLMVFMFVLLPGF